MSTLTTVLSRHRTTRLPDSRNDRQLSPWGTRGTAYPTKRRTVETVDRKSSSTRSPYRPGKRWIKVFTEGHRKRYKTLNLHSVIHVGCDFPTPEVFSHWRPRPLVTPSRISDGRCRSLTSFDFFPRRTSPSLLGLLSSPPSFPLLTLSLLGLFVPCHTSKTLVVFVFSDESQNVWIKSRFGRVCAQS